MTKRRVVRTKPLGTIVGNERRSKSSHTPSGSGFGRPDIGPGSKLQGKGRPHLRHTGYG